MNALLMMSQAWAWTCVNGCSSCSGMIAPGSSLTYGYLENDFTPAERQAINNGISAWNSGPGQELQDATWSFLVDGYYHPRGWWNGVDSVTTISLESGLAGFANAGAADNLAITQIAYTGCTRHPSRGWDTMFNDRYTWSTLPPSQLPEAGADDYTTPRSLGEVARHEFGHQFGLGHVTGNYVTALGTSSGDQGYGYWRTYEDEARALVAYRGNGGSSLNIILSTFTVKAVGSNGPSVENGWNWGTTQVPPGDVVWSSLKNGAVTASMAGSPSQTGAFDIIWTWDTTPCNGAAVASYTRRVNMYNNVPATYAPPTTLRVPQIPGSYWLCAHADPAGEVLDPEQARSEYVSAA